MLNIVIIQIYFRFLPYLLGDYLKSTSFWFSDEHYFDQSQQKLSVGAYFTVVLSGYERDCDMNAPPTFESFLLLDGEKKKFSK